MSDEAGNPAPQASHDIEVDTEAPSIFITTPIAGDDIINAAESDDPLTISGNHHVENGQTVTVTIDGKEYTTTVTDNAWSLEVPASAVEALAEGTQTIKADVSDEAGNPAPQASHDIEVDTEAPSIFITTPIAGDDIINAAESDDPLTISGTTTNVENGQTVTVTIDGKEYTTTVTDNAWSLEVPASAVEALAEGTQTIKADVSDEAGNPARKRAMISRLILKRRASSSPRQSQAMTSSMPRKVTIH
ncbi:Ig-like domain-containing protein [Vibrio vulnificus]|uniref:T1SS secreted agglutinin RTX n=1 Tax=Vibrio vulnificus TaxID=672 RepID=A0AAN1PNU7_VIBVL|nr:Ig-like domain-containing protein [Vibrio vulnificus]AXX59955.1 T1SS secreted agglutinin RTX [Vibrio vulnificus]